MQQAAGVTIILGLGGYLLVVTQGAGILLSDLTDLSYFQSIILAWLSYQGGPGYVMVFLFSAISLAVLLSPALFDLKDSRKNRGAEQPVLPAEQTSPSSPV